MAAKVKKAAKASGSKQMDGLVDALMQREDLDVSFACVVGAAGDIVERDCPNGHRTSIKDLLPAAMERARQRQAHTTEWDWKANSDEILAELNRVLNPQGVRVECSDATGDSVVFEFVPIDWRFDWEVAGMKAEKKAEAAS